MKIRSLTKFGKGLSDQGRVRILAMLQQRPGMCVCEITAALGLAQSTVSRHLQILEDAGLVVSRKTGQWVNFTIPEPRNEDDPVSMAVRLLTQLQNDPEIRLMLANLGTVTRETLKSAPPQSPDSKQ